MRAFPVIAWLKSIAAAEAPAWLSREAAAKLNVNREAVLRDIGRNSGVVPAAVGSNGAES